MRRVNRRLQYTQKCWKSAIAQAGRCGSLR